MAANSDIIDTEYEQYIDGDETVSEILREKTDVVAKARKKQEDIARWQQW